MEIGPGERLTENNDPNVQMCKLPMLPATQASALPERENILMGLTTWGQACTQCLLLSERRSQYMTPPNLRILAIAAPCPEDACMYDMITSMYRSEAVR
jgi:hypothetical protein